TASLVLWLIYLSYFILRAYISEDERRARFSAVVGIVGFIDVPIVAFAINFANTAHPSAGIFSDGMDGRMLLTLLLSIAAFTVMYLLFMMVGIQLRKNEQELKILKEAMKE
ncbi:MAG: cytochrome c biogenesis protein, partial [Dehalococcoidia bacterium]|nr:cytochrome c biogenesis protein [Dehalococcoidia bacterium]